MNHLKPLVSPVWVSSPTQVSIGDPIPQDAEMAIGTANWYFSRKLVGFVSMSKQQVGPVAVPERVLFCPRSEPRSANKPYSALGKTLTVKRSSVGYYLDRLLHCEDWSLLIVSISPSLVCSLVESVLDTPGELTG